MYTLTTDAVSDARSFALIAAVQAAYDAGGYAPAVITHAYVLQNAVRVGLHYWIPPAFFVGVPYPKGEPVTLPTAAKLTPATGGFVNYSVNVPAEDVAYANAIIAAVPGIGLVPLLGCALCTGLAMLSGLLPVQVGPWIAVP